MTYCISSTTETDKTREPKYIFCTKQLYYWGHSEDTKALSTVEPTHPALAIPTPRASPNILHHCALSILQATLLTPYITPRASSHSSLHTFHAPLRTPHSLLRIFPKQKTHDLQRSLIFVRSWQSHARTRELRKKIVANKTPPPRPFKKTTSFR